MTFFDVPIIPSAPLRLGQRVTIREIVPCDDFLPSRSARGTNHYMAKEQEMRGIVVAIRPAEATLTEVVVRNERREDLEAFAHLTIQHIQNVTVAMSLTQRLIRRAMLPFLLDARRIPVDRQPVVLRNEWKWVDGRRVLREAGSYTNVMRRRRAGGDDM
ncbi:hypothetical protein PYCCODRAFT_1378760 [Trametes coccinea BRFM310]|uniref:Uncharacterized protein n=1 Tax=Trametes coccinea (strain BRFM310) TaxID=1353009 RepID=A0A1Y2I844_TRAC3|nr:hypothetical protein PYCCODRAFT_1378760 [Trametes coccinea BRFM310]